MAGRAVPTRREYVHVGSRFSSLKTDGRPSPAGQPRQWILCCCEFENPSATAKSNTFELGMTCLRPFDDRDVINEPTGMCLRRVSGGSYPAQRGLRSCSGSRPSQPDRLGSAPLLQSKLIQAILLHPGNARRQRCSLLDRELLQQDIQHALGSRIECVVVSGLRRALHYQHALTALLIRIVAHPFRQLGQGRDRKSTRLNSSHVRISYAVFCLKKKT